jgi:hypothetical protein
MNRMLNIDAARAILDDRRRAADQARLVSLAKARQPPRRRPRYTLVLFIGAALGATAHIAAATVPTPVPVETGSVHHAGHYVAVTTHWTGLDRSPMRQ